MSILAGRFAGNSRRRRSDAPSEHVARIGWMLVRLLCDGVLDYVGCIDRFGISRREFQRDLLKLREIGKDHGFTISRITRGRAFLYSARPQAGRLAATNHDAKELLARIAGALGEPVERELRDAIGEVMPVTPGFLHVREALPNDGGYVADVFAQLKAAAAGPARIEFSYTTARGACAMRRVEPYHVVLRSGRSYLVGYDLDRRDWRYFALDAIGKPIRKAGTFSSRLVPERFLTERAVGWINGSELVEVTVRLSSFVAAAVASRRWQHGQRVTELPDGGAEIILTVSDLGEAVRWALGFGEEALVVAPAEAVALARRTIDRLARTYDTAGTPKRKLMTG